jgi:hypothetical protein
MNKYEVIVKQNKVSDLIESARNGAPAYINDVRSAFESLDEGEKLEIKAVLLSMDGQSCRSFSYTVPSVMRDEHWKVLSCDYLKAEVYNALSSLGGQSLEFYFDQNNETCRSLVAELIEGFDLKLSRNERKGYGRCINVIDRMLDALSPDYDLHFSMQMKDINELESISYYPEELSFGDHVFTRSVNGLGEKTILGIDVGGTDIKLALIGQGRILCMKEYDWFPPLFKESRELVDPIVLLTRLFTLWNALHSGSFIVPGEILLLLDQAMAEKTDIKLIQKACNEMESYVGIQDGLLDGIGMCFPDVVVNNKIVGGEVYKTRGIRLNPEIDYESDFKQLTHLDDKLKEFCKKEGLVSMTNDGPMAAFTAAVEQAASGETESLQGGFFAHTLGTELGTGWVREDGSIPDIPLEVYNCIIDLGSYPERDFHADDLRSVKNFNTDLPGTLQKYASQSGVFRLAMKYFPEERPELFEELLEKELVREIQVEVEGESKGRFVVPSENPDMRKPFLEHMMTLLERENDEVNHRIWQDIGESLGVALVETEKLLRPKAKKRILFGRLVKRKACFTSMEKGARNIVPEIEFEIADSDLAHTPLMKQLEGDEQFTVAQFAQAIGAVYYAVDKLVK